jgi:tryptophan-rich sensory protein
MKKSLKFIMVVLIPLAVGGLAGIITSSSVSTWYQTLVKPAFNPPAWIFAPVWNALYLMMGVALFIILEKGKGNIFYKKALWFFGVQLFLNFLWSILFFGLHNPGLALVEIILLWISILFTHIYFFKISKLAARLLLPYLAWVSFAAILNFEIWRLN